MDPNAPDPTVIRALPKAELHLHLDGSLRIDTAVELAAAAGIPLAAQEAASRLVAPPRCGSQTELLAYFDLPIALLQAAAALRRAAGELVRDVAEDGVRYVEIRWAPRLHLERGMSVRDVIRAVADGVADAEAALHGRGPAVGLIVTAMRSHPPGANVELARAAGEIGPPVVGFDLAGPEASFPAPPHAAAFRAAEDAGLALTAHAGEVAGSERIRDALGLGVLRIAHGATVADDPELIDLIRARDITLDLCPTSNVQAGVVPSLDAHPIASLQRAGVSVTLSTDDRTVSGTTLTDEYVRVATAHGVTRDELATLALNGFRRAFGPRTLVQPLLAAAEGAWTAWAAGRDPAGAGS